MRQITVDESEEDQKFVEQFIIDLDMLLGITKEMFVENKAMLLSPYLRQCIIDKAKAVKGRWDQIKTRVHVDNPTKPLTVWEESWNL